MRNIKTLICAVLLCSAVIVSAAFSNKKPVAKLSKATFEGKGFAVVELFTSEGCSSCPSADAVVAKIEKESAGKPVYILAYHVDYWNRLGWKDVFSSADYSRRQNTYANWLNLSSVYTPQVVVNGRKEFVGSQEGTLRNAITAGIGKAGKTALTLDGLKAGSNQATIKYKADGAGENTALVLALVEKNATTVVKAGENGGRTLSHVQIVTKIQNIALNGDKNGETSISLPKNFTAQNYEVIAFVQNVQNGEILAASRAAFPTVSASN
ncbi:DUF1223 domain-containing protein [Mucilaginibacter gilvus]|uniref:DUF1223 domain-containing protein n=1 Tax=Mucilaginibacter gilvus TaxID=2305909 RepID=A0A3S4YD23_9SPHI|nr:DUF1223 domain-containing protein [Mucilaginibacter gilvus]RWY52535.1 DUF1223 domain-containing protein [Mucilaginibacter gilvus]